MKKVKSALDVDLRRPPVWGGAEPVRPGDLARGQIWREKAKLEAELEAVLKS